MNRRYVAVDLGAESGRVIVGSIDNGFEIEVINRFHSRNTRVHETLYWDLLYIFDRIKEGLKKAVELYGQEIVSIGVDTWGVDYGLLDGNGHLLGNPVHYRDDRTDGMMEEVFTRLDRESIYYETGIQFMPINTLYQLASEVKTNSSGLAGADRLLMIPDLLNYWLSGVMANEYTISSTSQLYNPETWDWSATILGAIGVKPGLFRSVIMPGTVLGPLHPALSAELDIRHKISVVATAGHDTAAAVAAVPAKKGSNGAYLSSGTWSLLGVELPKPFISPESLVANVTNEGGADGGIRLLKNIMGLWILQECRRCWEAEGHVVDYATLAETAGDTPDGYILNVDDPRFLKPGRGEASMPNRIITFCRETEQQIPSTPPEFARGIFRGLSAAYAETIDLISRVIGNPVDILHIIGGGCQNTLLNQMTADAAGIPVTAGPVEATAMGNIMMQAVASGDLTDQDEGRELILSNGSIRFFYPSTLSRKAGKHEQPA